MTTLTKTIKKRIYNNDGTYKSKNVPKWNKDGSSNWVMASPIRDSFEDSNVIFYRTGRPTRRKYRNLMTYVPTDLLSFLMANNSSNTHVNRFMLGNEELRILQILNFNKRDPETRFFNSEDEPVWRLGFYDLWTWDDYKLMETFANHGVLPFAICTKQADCEEGTINTVDFLCYSIHDTFVFQASSEAKPLPEKFPFAKGKVIYFDRGNNEFKNTGLSIRKFESSLYRSLEPEYYDEPVSDENVSEIGNE